MKTREPSLRKPAEALRQIFGMHGPLRYQDPSNPFNGAVTLIQPSDAWANAKSVQEMTSCDLHGEGAVWAWFVGSPKAFEFGFVRSHGWAVRKMVDKLKAAFEAVTSERPVNG